MPPLRVAQRSPHEKLHSVFRPGGWVSPSTSGRSDRIHARRIATVGGDSVNSPQAHFVISGHLGYPEMVTDTTGTPLWTSDHLPFGETVPETGEINDPPRRYPGQWAVVGGDWSPEP